MAVKETAMTRVIYYLKKIPFFKSILAFIYPSIKKHITSNLSLDKLLLLSSNIINHQLNNNELYQPLYGYNHFTIRIPQRPCLDRADVIYRQIQPMGQTQVLDIGCSQGYFSYYFAARGYIVDGIDNNPSCIQICRLLHLFNPSNIPSFATQAFDLPYIQKIQYGKYNIAFLLSVVHHIICEHGIEYTQNLMQTLCEKIPIIIIELALQHEDVPFPWKKELPLNELDIFNTCKNIRINKLGYFPTHLSHVKRPLYIIQHKNIQIDHHDYEIKNHTFVTNESIPWSYRSFYETNDFFVKNYCILNHHPIGDINHTEITNETTIYQKLPPNRFFPKFLHCIYEKNNIKLILSRLPGITLKQAIETNALKLQPTFIVKQLIDSIRFFRSKGYYHNDIRPWNIIVHKNDIFIFDLGLSKPIEIEDTIITILWIIFQVHHSLLINYPHYPVTIQPTIRVNTLEPELQVITHKLLQASSIDEYFITEKEYIAD